MSARIAPRFVTTPCIGSPRSTSRTPTKEGSQTKDRRHKLFLTTYIAVQANKVHPHIHNISICQFILGKYWDNSSNHAAYQPHDDVALFPKL